MPFDVDSTPFGDIAVLICADTFLMDWVRIGIGAEVSTVDFVIMEICSWICQRQIGSRPENRQLLQSKIP